MARKQPRTMMAKCPSGLSRAKQQVWDQLNDLIQQRPLDLTKWREVGLLVDQYVVAGSQSSKQGGMTSLGHSLGCAHSELYYAKRLAVGYDEKELRDLQTRGFGWGKMMNVLSVEGREARTALIEDAIRNDWSARRLKTEIHQRHGYQAKPASRSRHKLEYAGFEEGLHELIRQCRNWMRYHQCVWHGESDSMVKDLGTLPQEKKDRGLLELLQQVKGEIRQVARSCSQLEEVLEQAVSEIVAVLTANTA